MKCQKGMNENGYIHNAKDVFNQFHLYLKPLKYVFCTINHSSSFISFLQSNRIFYSIYTFTGSLMDNNHNLRTEISNSLTQKHNSLIIFFGNIKLSTKIIHAQKKQMTCIDSTNLTLLNLKRDSIRLILAYCADIFTPSEESLILYFKVTELCCYFLLLCQEGYASSGNRKKSVMVS